MRISKKEMIANVPILRIRDFFAFLQSHQFDEQYISNYLQINKIEFDLLIKELLEKGYIQKNGQNYELTLKGNALRIARCVTPINKEKADKILLEFMNRVEEVNTNDYYLYKVTKILLFGSYVDTSSSDYGDIDIAYELEKKEKDYDKFEELNKHIIDKALSEGKRFSSFIEELYYTRNIVVLKLKNKNQYISLHEIDDKILEQTETKQIYP